MALESDFTKYKAMNADLEKDLGIVEEEKEKKLVEILSRQLIKTYLPDAEGIGEKLTKKILDECFDGTLESLRYAYIVNGVGDSKQYGINEWLGPMERKFQYQLGQDFPGKMEIMEGYTKKHGDLKNRLKEVSEKLRKMEELGKEADKQRLFLEGVKFKHFMRSYFEPAGKDTSIERYILGVHPEWEPMPEWFRDLLEEYGGVND